MDLSFYIEEVINLFFRKKWYFIACIIIFLFSTMLGIILKKPILIADFYRDYCENYICIVFSKGGNVFFLFGMRILCNVLFLLPVCLSAFHFILIPVPVLLLAYRGFVLGIEIFVLVSCYSFQGIAVVFLLIVPQNFILAATICFLSVFTGKCEREFRAVKSLCVFRAHLPILLIFLLVVVAAAILELLLILLFFKPFTWII